MRLALLATIDHPRLWKASPTRIRLVEGDVYRVPRQVRHLQIVSGQAWVSCSGKDIILSSGQQMAFTADMSNDIALIGCIDGTPLLFEAAKK